MQGLDWQCNGSHVLGNVLWEVEDSIDPLPDIGWRAKARSVFPNTSLDVDSGDFSLFFLTDSLVIPFLLL